MPRNITTVYLSALASELGNPVKATSLDPGLAEAQNVCISSEAVSVLGSRSISRTVGCSKQLAASARIILLSSSDMSADAANSWRGSLAQSETTRNRQLIGIGLNACASLGSAMSFGAAAIDSGSEESVLLVAADSAVGKSRLMEDDEGVLSDGAASCLLSRQVPDEGFRIIGIASSYLSPDDIESLPEHRRLNKARAVMNGVRDAVRKLYALTGVAPEEISRISLGHYNASSRKLLLLAARMNLDSAFADPGLGHFFSADTLLDLEAALRSGSLASGEKVLALMSAPFAWSAVALQAL